MILEISEHNLYITSVDDPQKRCKTEQYGHYLIKAPIKKALIYDRSKYESLRQMKVNKERVARSTVSFEDVVIDTEV